MQAGTTDREKTALKWFAVVGLLFAIGADAVLFQGPFVGLGQTSRPWMPAFIKILTLCVQTLSAVAFTLCFARVLIVLRLSPWAALVVGAAVGALAAGLSLGLAMGTQYAIGVRAGAIVLDGASAVQSTWPWWRLFGTAFAHSFVLGAYGGLIPGALAGVALSLGLGHGDGHHELRGISPASRRA